MMLQKLEQTALINEYAYAQGDLKTFINRAVWLLLELMERDNSYNPDAKMFTIKWAFISFTVRAKHAASFARYLVGDRLP